MSAPRVVRSSSVKSETYLTKEPAASEPAASEEDDDNVGSADIDLNTSSRLDDFRRFFDFQSECWGPFRNRLAHHVLSTSSWREMLREKDKRGEMAVRFINQHGEEYWGSEESRKKFLMEAHILDGKAFHYPGDRKTLIQAVKLLLEKTAKHRRESTALEVCFPNGKAPESRSCEGEPSSPRGKPLALTSGAKTPKESMQDADCSSHFIVGSGKVQATKDLLLQNVDRLTQNIHSTFFLVQDEMSEDEAACVPFEVFKTSSEFLSKMEDHAGVVDLDGPSKQFFDEMPILQRRYAVVQLGWSQVEFVIRAHRDEDLQALMNRVGCAWRAKAQGDVTVFEFEIRVTLKTVQ